MDCVVIVNALREAGIAEDFKGCESTSLVRIGEFLSANTEPRAFL
jgi:hypothetical protein